ncbi:HNH/endonuclease VII fold toxin-2 domain-containing protein, partial [Providencia rettgeri]
MQRANGASFNLFKYDKDACPNYDEAIAPTVCVEGISWHGGSHGRIHTAMDDELSRLVKNNKLDNNT